MLLTSPSFKDGSDIPRKFTCDGGDINPELEIHNVPDDAKSLLLVLHDPDAPRAGGFAHWLVWNINPKTTFIKEESVPPGATEGANGAREVRYMGPCPGQGSHHYHFKLYALDAMLDLPEGTELDGLAAAMTGHVLAETELVGMYKRI
jgi:Raf kinase inhibitor-like YbhB/YbcL family protein